MRMSKHTHMHTQGVGRALCILRDNDAYRLVPPSLYLPLVIYGNPSFLPLFICSLVQLRVECLCVAGTGRIPQTMLHKASFPC